MKIIKILTLIAFLCLVACASNPALRVSDAQGIDSVSAIGMTCKKPFALTQNCSGFSGPSKKITVNGQNLKVGGNSDGTITVMFGKNSTQSANLGFDLLKAELISRGHSITKVTPIESSGIMFGYAIETAKPSYDIWKEFVVK